MRLSAPSAESAPTVCSSRQAETKRAAPSSHHDAPLAVDDDRRVGLVAFDHAAQRLANTLHVRAPEWPLRVERRIAGRHEQLVSGSQRNVQGVAQPQDHVTARLRPPRLDEAQMALRDVRTERKAQLALLPARAPVAELDAERARSRGLSSFAVFHRPDPWGALCA